MTLDLFAENNADRPLQSPDERPKSSQELLKPPQDLRQQVVERSASCLRLAGDHFGRHFPIPEIRFDLRGASAGQAVFIRQGRKEEIRLRFNDSLMLKNPGEFLSQVVPHEVAHLVARLVYGRRIRPHGPEWQSVMRDVLGVAPQVRHQMDVRDIARSRPRHLYHCACPQREHWLSSIRHNRIQRAEQRYLCRTCRQHLCYDGQSGSPSIP